MSVRLSPAANLLRNSKLFALPPAIALPSKAPSSNEISESDTATTPYPQFAAIETTYTGSKTGDWGLKRPLPLKTTKNTNNAVVRLLRGIDTREHIADFESASDHVLTLRKFEELDHPIKLAFTDEGAGGARQSRQDLNFKAFRALSDNTTNLSPSAPFRQPGSPWSSDSPDGEVTDRLPPKLREKQVEIIDKKILPEKSSTAGDQFANMVTRGNGPVGRWRYRGPSLTQVSGMEFEEYLTSLGTHEISQLHERVRDAIILDKQNENRDSGSAGQVLKKEDITDQQVQERIRILRREPAKFGPMIAKILDLPYVAPPKELAAQTDWWQYGASSLASPVWGNTGTPKTHPSAGLSYATGTNVVNHPRYGPQMVSNPVVARAVRKKARINNTVTTWGVAGFIADTNDNIDRSSSNSQPFEKRPGGMKTAVQPRMAWITAEGRLRMKIYEHESFVVRDNKAITKVEDAAINAEKKAAEEAAAEALLQGELGSLAMNKEAKMPNLSAQQPGAPSSRSRGASDAALDDRLDQMLGARR